MRLVLNAGQVETYRPIGVGIHDLDFRNRTGFKTVALGLHD